MIGRRILTCAPVMPLEYCNSQSPLAPSVWLFMFASKIQMRKTSVVPMILELCLLLFIFFLPLVHWKLLQNEPVRFSWNGESWERIIKETRCRGGWPRWYCEHQLVSHWLRRSGREAWHASWHFLSLFTPHPSPHRPLHPLHLYCFASSSSAAAATAPFLSTLFREGDARHCPRVTSWLHGQWTLCLLSMRLVFFPHLVSWRLVHFVLLSCPLFTRSISNSN